MPGAERTIDVLPRAPVMVWGVSPPLPSLPLALDWVKDDSQDTTPNV
jgi:hypothetical protein